LHTAGLAIFGPPIMLQVPIQTDILQSYASHVCKQTSPNWIFLWIFWGILRGMFLGIFGGILFEFFGNSLGILGKFLAEINIFEYEMN
jgi:hypothetical protein